MQPVVCAAAGAQTGKKRGRGVLIKADFQNRTRVAHLFDVLERARGQVIHRHLGNGRELALGIRRGLIDQRALCARVPQHLIGQQDVERGGHTQTTRFEDDETLAALQEQHVVNPLLLRPRLKLDHPPVVRALNVVKIGQTPQRVSQIGVSCHGVAVGRDCSPYC